MTIYIKTADGWKPWVAAHVTCDNHNDLQGVYRPVSRLQAMIENDRRASAFAFAVSDHVKGNIGKERIFNAFKEPVYGAFGEQL